VLLAWSRQISIMDSMVLVLGNVGARVGGMPRRPMARVSASLTQAGRRAGGAVQLPRERIQLRLGDQRVGEVGDATHPLGDGGGQRLGQPVGAVAELVELQALMTGWSNTWVTARPSALAPSITPGSGG
jgi:hypothetical protein